MINLSLLLIVGNNLLDLCEEIGKLLHVLFTYDILDNV